MRKLLEKIQEALNWIILAGWYKGGDMGDGILVSILSALFFIGGGITTLIYCIYKFLI